MKNEIDTIDEILAQELKKFRAKDERIPEFEPGDTLRVTLRVVDGDDVHSQVYEGVCIARSGKGLHENFTVRKISYGEGVERVFPLYSPFITGIEVVRRGKVRRTKLYYMRGRRRHAALKTFKLKGKKDDLKRIENITPDLETMLNKLNIIKLEQIATFTDDDIANIDDALGLNGQINEEDWVGQAQRLIAEAGLEKVSPEPDCNTSEFRTTSPDDVARREKERQEIISRVKDWAGSKEAAETWYVSQPIPALGNQTAEGLVAVGKAEFVRHYLNSIAVGGFA